ncbi:hypothetical protein GGH94_005492 [Coemansia aciculifera]|uniref:Uncharacterized protein n=1 Tax=Coemansia aciculifera TaxID=417176 RepID=A0A9W8IID3_9FUNG|nr:hypothetical protein GGH94_005492 [Coemansia aciculifera]
MSKPTATEKNAVEDSAQHDPANSETTELVQGLASTAQTMSSSLQSMQQALIGNMQQAAQMTMSMNMMMEELVKRAVQVGVHTERLRLPQSLPSSLDAAATGYRPRYRCALRITIGNKSPIPLLKMTTKLWFSKRIPSQSSTATIPTRSETQGRTDENQIEISPLNRRSDEKPTTFEDSDLYLLAFSDTQGTLPESLDMSVEPLVQGTLGSSTYLPSGATANATLELSVSALEQLNGAISIEFASPGTGGTLSVAHRFGIRLLHLVDCNYVAAVEAAPAVLIRQLDKLPGISAVTVDIGRIREVFAVPPADGIAPGALLLFGLSLADCTIGLQIGSIAHDSQSAVCEWISSIDDDQTLPSLVPLLAEELTA